MRAARRLSCLFLVVLVPVCACAVEIVTDPAGAHVWTSPWQDPAMHYQGESPITIDRPAETIQLIVRLAGYLPVYTELQPTQDRLSLTITPEPADPGERVVIGRRDFEPGVWVGPAHQADAAWLVRHNPREKVDGDHFWWSPDGRYVAWQHTIITGFADPWPPYYFERLLLVDVAARSVKQIAWANPGGNGWAFNPVWSFDAEYVLFERPWSRELPRSHLVAWRPMDGSERVVAADAEAEIWYGAWGPDGSVYYGEFRDEQPAKLCHWNREHECVIASGHDFRYPVVTIWGDLLWRDERGVVLLGDAGEVDLVVVEDEDRLLTAEGARAFWREHSHGRLWPHLEADAETVSFDDGIGRFGLTTCVPEGPGERFPRHYIWSRREGLHEQSTSEAGDDTAQARLSWVKWSRDGTWLLATGERRSPRQHFPVFLVRADGSESIEVEPVTDVSDWCRSFDWGPGNRIALCVGEDRHQYSRNSLWLMDDPHGRPRKLVPHVLGWSCTWSPDGSRIAVIVGEEWRETQVALVDVATGEVTTITDVGDWESVAWHPSKPELAFARYWWHTYGIMATDGTVTFEHGDPYKGGCGAWWSHDDRLRVGEDGSLLLDRDGNVAPLDRPLTGCYGSIGTLAAWTSDDRYVAMLADHAIIIAEREALAYDPEDPWPCTELKPGREPVRIIFPEGEWLQGEPCPTLAPLQGQ